MWYSILLLFPVLLFLFRRRYYSGTGRNKLNLPPGPRPWPLIGNLHLIGILPHKSIHSLSQKYGPLMSLRFGVHSVVVGSSPEVAELLLKTHDVTFATRPSLLGGKHTLYEYSGLANAPYGPYWRQARKICLMEVLCPKRLDQLEYIRVEESRTFFASLCKSSSANVHLRDRLYMLNLATMTRMVSGRSYTEENNQVVDPKELMGWLEELFLLNGVLDIGDSIPWLAPLDLQGHVKRMKTVSKKLDGFYEHILNEHQARRMKSGKGYEARDMVDVLLQLADDPATLIIKLERHQIKALVQDMILAAIDTTTVSIEWAMAELMKNPQVIQRATEELDKVIGRNRWVEEKDIADLPYIAAIVKESMRLHPVAPLLVPRVARENCKVAGYDILKNTRVFVNVWAIGRDPAIWGSKPTKFWPERFFEKQDIDMKGHNFELLPFGSGRRMCLGYTLGLKVVHTILANLLHGFDWKLNGNMKIEDLDMEERFGFTTSRVNPLVLVPRPRLADHLYLLSFVESASSLFK